MTLVCLFPVQVSTWSVTLNKDFWVAVRILRYMMLIRNHMMTSLGQNLPGRYICSNNLFVYNYILYSFSYSTLCMKLFLIATFAYRTLVWSCLVLQLNEKVTSHIVVILVLDKTILYTKNADEQLGNGGSVRGVMWLKIKRICIAANLRLKPHLRLK